MSWGHYSVTHHTVNSRLREEGPHSGQEAGAHTTARLEAAYHHCPSGRPRRGKKAAATSERYTEHSHTDGHLGMAVLVAHLCLAHPQNAGPFSCGSLLQRTHCALLHCGYLCGPGLIAVGLECRSEPLVLRITCAWGNLQGL